MLQSLKKGAYNVVIVSPEQFFRDPASGATPRLLGLLHTNRTFLHSIKHIYIDEGHEIFLSGIERHGIPAFRPSYGELEKILPKLPNRTTVHVLSATLPPHIIKVIEGKLFGSRERVHIQLPLNRRNIVYATRTITDLSEYKNLSFLIPRYNPNSRPSGVIVFFESSVRADDAASFLNNTFRTLHPTCKISRITASYHAGLSQTCLTRVFRQFCGTHESGEQIDILCATSCGATVWFLLTGALHTRYATQHITDVTSIDTGYRLPKHQGRYPVWDVPRPVFVDPKSWPGSTHSWIRGSLHLYGGDLGCRHTC